MKNKRKCILLNALPLNAFQYNEFTIRIKKVMVEELNEMLKKCDIIENYIRHESTIKLLSQILNISLTSSTYLYKYQDMDRLIVITLKSPIRGQEHQNVSKDDLDIFVVDLILNLN